MPTISTHVLNNVDGTHAAGVRVECVGYAADGTRTVLFCATTDDGGRLSADVEVPVAVYADFSLEFFTGAYFNALGLATNALVQSVQFRIQLQPGDGHHHIPVIAGPHGCASWWSP